ncbi:LysR family transcriptional regulator [Duganella sp. FT92W]|uniref:LysR family transcriptional regulator n=1 Tax=Pseudoduganella rivuli TaxID=2666085 RepID=A0A7X2IUJ6_9BURK|nr:LysR family transcriptional regulator [Pseudoduganella rivuli]MRV76072.1 LysR family transcriptional regulator [Pseudoduganella rivuli]
MSRTPSLHQLECFLALADEGSYAAAAQRLHKSHTAVFATIRNLEETVGVALLDRGGYRVTLTPAGESFREEADRVVRSHAALARHALQLRSGAEAELRIALGDLCPLDSTLARFTGFFRDEPQTRPVFRSEVLAAPWASLLRGEADLAIHHIDQPRPELEAWHLFDVRVIPVAAPGLLPFAPHRQLQPADLRSLRQCILRDGALDWPAPSYHVLDGAPQVSVGDQATKREVLLQGLAWGHMPEHLVQADLEAGRLLPLTGEHLRGATLPHYALRLREVKHGPVAQRLWRRLQG